MVLLDLGWAQADANALANERAWQENTIKDSYMANVMPQEHLFQGSNYAYKTDLLPLQFQADKQKLEHQIELAPITHKADMTNANLNVEKANTNLNIFKDYGAGMAVDSAKNEATTQQWNNQQLSSIRSLTDTINNLSDTSKKIDDLSIQLAGVNLADPTSTQTLATIQTNLATALKGTGVPVPTLEVQNGTVMARLPDGRVAPVSQYISLANTHLARGMQEAFGKREQVYQGWASASGQYPRQTVSSGQAQKETQPTPSQVAAAVMGGTGASPTPTAPIMPVGGQGTTTSVPQNTTSNVQAPVAQPRTVPTPAARQDSNKVATKTNAQVSVPQPSPTVAPTGTVQVPRVLPADPSAIKVAPKYAESPVTKGKAQQAVADARTENVRLDLLRKQAEDQQNAFAKVREGLVRNLQTITSELETLKTSKETIGDSKVRQELTKRINTLEANRLSAENAIRQHDRRASIAIDANVRMATQIRNTIARNDIDIAELTGTSTAKQVSPSATKQGIKQGIKQEITYAYPEDADGAYSGINAIQLAPEFDNASPVARASMQRQVSNLFKEDWKLQREQNTVHNTVADREAKVQAVLNEIETINEQLVQLASSAQVETDVAKKASLEKARRKMLGVRENLFKTLNDRQGDLEKYLNITNQIKARRQAIDADLSRLLGTGNQFVTPIAVGGR